MEPNIVNEETDNTYWHPAFYADIQIELKDDADNLIFENEHQLSKMPMEIDVLIIKKETDRPVKKNIGRLFKKHNIVEYKSPTDSLSVDDFYKVYGYACFYKVDVPRVNSISVNELTITFVSEKYPRKLIRHLKEVKNYQVKMADPGIYYVEGDIIPIQIIVTSQLSESENLWLKNLTNKLKDLEKARQLVRDYLRHADNGLYQAVMDAITRANQRTFEEVNSMSDIFMEICKEKFDRKLKEELDRKVKEELDKKLQEELDKAVERENARRLTEHISLIQKKCAKNKPLSVIADELESSPEEILPVYTIVSKNPGKTPEEIYELISG